MSLPRRLSLSARVTVGKDSGVLLFDLVPRNLLGKQHPPIVTPQPAAERKIEVFKGPLIGVFLSIDPCLQLQAYDIPVTVFLARVTAYPKGICL